MEGIEAIMTRRSVRSFTEEPLTDEELDMLLRAAMAAPSASNGRPWRFLVVRERDRLERLSRATPFAKPVAGAGAGVVVCVDKLALKYPGFWVIDCAAAIQNMLLAARSTGLGGVWIGVHPVQPLVSSVRRAMELPRHIAPHSIVALGHPERTPEPVDRFEAEWVHRERW